MKESHGSEMHAPPAMGAASQRAGARQVLLSSPRFARSRLRPPAPRPGARPSIFWARSKSFTRSRPSGPPCPMSIPESARKRRRHFGDSACRAGPETRVTIHDSNTRPPSRPTRAPGPPDSDVALNTHDLATADTDRAPAASRTVHPIMVEIFGLRPALRRNRSPTHRKDPFPLISLLPRPFSLREQLCLRRVR